MGQRRRDGHGASGAGWRAVVVGPGRYPRRRIRGRGVSVRYDASGFLLGYTRTDGCRDLVGRVLRAGLRAGRADLRALAGGKRCRPSPGK